MTLSDLIQTQAEVYNGKTFLLFEHQLITDGKSLSLSSGFRLELTYSALNQRVNQACHLLNKLGIIKGDVINLHLPNCPSFIILWFAAARLGAVMMPTNVLSSTEELIYLLDHSASKVTFTSAKYTSSLQECQTKVGSLKQFIICDIFSHQPEPDSFEAQLSRQPVSAWKTQLDPLDLVSIMYTSGTTSKPKGVMVSHANYFAAGNTVADHLELTEQDRQFVVLPLFHGNAQYYSIMSALLRGASAVLMDRFSASQYFDKCCEYECTVASLFAAPMRMILAQPDNPKHRANSIRVVIYAQNLTEQQLEEWSKRFDASLCQIWGMTETMGPPLMNPLHGERKNQTIGKPTADYQIKLTDENGNSVANGEEGEILVKGIPGQTIMSGYYKNPAASESTIKNNWLHTGDNAVLDEDGFYRFVDRKKDMIKRSGENVSAGEVENVLLQHPDVFECAVIGIPDDIKDESIVAVVVAKPGAKPTTDELLEFCRGKLASFRVPETVLLVAELPKTSVGKIQKHLIRNELIQKLSDSKKSVRTQ
ncbi:MAG: crotonobetaine/carnitine-CoA ligase [Gammaproteobacteria bacterium]|jgi:crotonobetaine/carnitine-CoA ligase